MYRFLYSLVVVSMWAHMKTVIIHYSWYGHKQIIFLGQPSTHSLFRAKQRRRIQGPVFIQICKILSRKRAVSDWLFVTSAPLYKQLPHKEISGSKPLDECLSSWPQTITVSAPIPASPPIPASLAQPPKATVGTEDVTCNTFSRRL